MKNNNKKELIRFIITGLVCALLDFLVSKLFLSLCASLDSWLAMLISVTMGFIVGVISNYFLSTYWVFKGKKNENETKTFKFITLFVLFSIVALGLSYGTMILCEYVCNSAWNIDITQSDLMELFTFQFWGDLTFWLYFISFCLKTLVGLIWNYLTRKYILYK